MPDSPNTTPPVNWKRLYRDILLVILVLAAAELVLRIEPVSAVVSRELDVYENLLWYDIRLPSYKMQLESDPNYDIWLLGSSYMMTGLHPGTITAEIKAASDYDLTVQNYGFTTLVSLETMSVLVDKWLLELDQPRYVVLGVAKANFEPGTDNLSRIENSPYESAKIYPDNLDERIAIWLYDNSRLYHYGILLRNALLKDRSVAERSILEYGGYSERSGQINCAERDPLPRVDIDYAERFYKLDAMLDILEARGIPTMVVTLPVSGCMMQMQFGDYTTYARDYLDPLTRHLQTRGVTVFNTDIAFYELTLAEQDAMFDDLTHMNADGAAYLSKMSSLAIVDWLDDLP